MQGGQGQIYRVAFGNAVQRQPHRATQAGPAAADLDVVGTAVRQGLRAAVVGQRTALHQRTAHGAIKGRAAAQHQALGQAQQVQGLAVQRQPLAGVAVELAQFAVGGLKTPQRLGLGHGMKGRVNRCTWPGIGIGIGIAIAIDDIPRPLPIPPRMPLRTPPRMPLRWPLDARG